MHKHHMDSIENMITYFKAREGIIGLILGGSVARGTERPDSDLDAIVIVSEAAYERQKNENRLSEVVRGMCTYEGGYFDVKYFTKEYLRAAAEKGSEPTRNSFTGSRVLFSEDDEIQDLITRIPIYPVEKKQSNIELFYSIFQLSKGYFYNCAVKENNTYLLAKSCYETVYSGMRMLFAYNETLFPCHRSMMKYAEKLAHKPQDIVTLAECFLDKKDADSKNAFTDAVMNYTDWGIDFSDYNRYLSIYVKKMEQSWENSDDNIYEL